MAAWRSGPEEVPVMMWYWGGGVQWWGWLLGAVGMLVFWSLVIWAVWYLLANVVRRSEPDHRTGDPRRILDERLARGEIDADEYRRLRDLLTGRADHAPGGPDREADGRERVADGRERVADGRERAGTGDRH